jgi:hypothetical protein
MIALTVKQYKRKTPNNNYDKNVYIARVLDLMIAVILTVLASLAIYRNSRLYQYHQTSQIDFYAPATTLDSPINGIITSSFEYNVKIDELKEAQAFSATQLLP